MTEEQVYKFKMIAQTERYYDENSNWGVYVFTTKDKIPYLEDYYGFDTNEQSKGLGIIAGNMQKLYIGNEYNIEATLTYNSRYNQYQYTPIIISSDIPKSLEQQRKFLETLITEKQAETILNVYPNIVEDITKNEDNVDLSLLNGIGEKTWNRIKTRVMDNYVISDILVLLQPLGVTYNMIQKLLMGESNPHLLKNKLLDNPYIMTKIKGLGFKRVDELALKLNPEIVDSSKRAYAFLRYYLKSEGNNNGHTWVKLCNLDNAIRENIPECFDVYTQIINECKEQNNNVMLYYQDNKIGLRNYYNMEKNIYDSLIEMKKYDKELDIDDKIGIKITEDETGFKLTDEQKSIVKKSLKHNLTFITGKAGCGKTTISRAILQSYKKAGYSISACALSAKAAQRIIEATGFQATTIHRLIGLKPNENEVTKPIETDVLFVDESSMLNCEVFYALLNATTEKTRIIFVGDDMQLPPIGYGNVFSDILAKKDTFNVFELKTVMRQAAKSGILTDANKIRNGIFPIEEPQSKIVSGELKDMIYVFKTEKKSLQNLAVQNYLSAIKEYSLDEVVILTPRKNNCINSTFEYNNIIQDKLISNDVPNIKYGKKVFKLGAKVVQRTNDYDKNVFNGEIGYITNIEDRVVNNKSKKYFEVKFSLSGKIVEYEEHEIENLDLAYAMTVHLSQGSDYKVVIVVIDNSHYIMLDSCLLYTAITRAKNKCALLSEIASFRMCISKNKNKIRQTWISQFSYQQNK